MMRTVSVDFNVSLGSDLSRRSPSASLAHWKSCVGAASSFIPEPSLNVSHRLTNEFHVSSSIPTSTIGLLSLGPLDAWICGRECSKAWILRRGTIASMGKSSVLYVQPGAGQLTITIVDDQACSTN